MVVGADPGSKFDKAKSLGVPILDEAQFEKLLAQTEFPSTNLVHTSEFAPQMHLEARQVDVGIGNAMRIIIWRVSRVIAGSPFARAADGRKVRTPSS